MSEKKDYLNQLASEIVKKPESFKEESFERVAKKQVNLDPKIIGIGVLVVVILAVVAFIFLSPKKIEMPDFVNKPKSDVNDWIKQEEIDPSRMVMNEEYSLTVEDGNIISQSVDAGTKITADEKHTFVESLGADPDEIIGLADIANMNKDEITAWIDENKLAKTKINLTYSETVEEGLVISYDLKNIEPEQFKRGTSLTINISKGEAPAGVITLEDFVKKPVAIVEDFAKNKKIELKIIETYSDEHPEGTVISQSIESGKTMKEKETLTVTVSLGKAVTVVNFKNFDKSDVDSWIADNPTANVKLEEMYSNESGYVLSQSIASGKMIDKEDKLVIKVNLGRPRLEKDFIGSELRELIDWTNTIRSKGTDMQAGSWNSESMYSTVYRKNQIMSMKCSGFSDATTYDCAGDLPVDARFDVVLSKGLKVVLPAQTDATEVSIPNFGDAENGGDADSITTWLSGLKFNYSVENAGNEKPGLYKGTTRIYAGNGEFITEDLTNLVVKK